MPYNAKYNKYKENYSRENYDRIQLVTPKGTRDKLKSEADRRGLPSVNALLNLLISSALDISADLLPTDQPAADETGKDTYTAGSLDNSPKE